MALGRYVPNLSNVQTLAEISSIPRDVGEETCKQMHARGETIQINLSWGSLESRFVPEILLLLTIWYRNVNRSKNYLLEIFMDVEAL